MPLQPGTAENPQLYFPHYFKVGDTLELAHEIRTALKMMNLKFE